MGAVRAPQQSAPTVLGSVIDVAAKRDTGSIQTSIFMFESEVVVKVAAIRQNAGKLARTSPFQVQCKSRPRTGSAAVIVVFGNTKLARIAHVAAQSPQPSVGMLHLATTLAVRDADGGNTAHDRVLDVAVTPPEKPHRPRSRTDARPSRSIRWSNASARIRRRSALSGSAMSACRCCALRRHAASAPPRFDIKAAAMRKPTTG